MIAIIVIVVSYGVFNHKLRPNVRDGLSSPISVTSSSPSQVDNHHDHSAQEPYKKNLDELTAILTTQTPHAALQELAQRMITDPYVLKNCHAVAHELGHAGYNKYKDFATALKYQDTTCSDGYLHGVIEERLAKSIDFLADIKTICKGYANLNSFAAGRCYHGLGHGLMFYTGNDLPKSTEICRTTFQEPALNRCYEGVFMENFLSDHVLHPSSYVDPANPSYPCDKQLPRARLICYFYAPTYYLSLNNDDYRKTIQWCQTFAAGLDASCVRGTSSLAMKFNITDPKAVESMCSTAKSSLTFPCIQGMVSYYLTYYDSVSKGKEMCVMLDPSNKQSCLSALPKSYHAFVD